METDGSSLIHICIDCLLIFHQYVYPTCLHAATSMLMLFHTKHIAIPAKSLPAKTLKNLSI